ncbi:hypothetical protein SEA_MACGULLY_61 [Rhodococcus phage MacGully]|nr:hypothetical protein SEA_MACGULLY_61 [Rhodococcus phage MacGully]
MSDKDDISHLDFEAVVPCEMAAQPYIMRREFFGRSIPTPMPGIPRTGPCLHPSSTIVSWRICPCWGDVRQWAEANPKFAAEGRFPPIIGGLITRPIALCDRHLSYFFEYIQYPFVCGGCGVAFLHPGEMILDGADIFENKDDNE